MKSLFKLTTVAAMFVVAAFSARATVYTDATNDSWGSAEVDFSAVVVTNDGNNLSFSLLFHPGATNGIGSGANYLVGIQIPGAAAQGQTVINGTTTGATAGNPWGKRVGISSGMNYFIGCFPNGTGYSGGAQLYYYTNGFGWSGQIGATASIIENTNAPVPSITFVFPLSALGLGVGSNFVFDVWASYNTAGQGAYDALDSALRAPVPPWTPTNYDSATAAGSVLNSYTVISGAAYQAQITFQVDMGVAIEQGLFDPSFGDYVEARGSFDGWPTGDHAGLLLTNVPTTTIFATTLVTNSIPLGVSVDYKFVIDSGVRWEGNVGPGGAQNRSFTLTNTTQVLPLAFWNNVTNANLAFPVTFSVNMGVPSAYGTFVPGTDTIYVNGDWDWSGAALQLTQTADPNVYTGTVALAYSPGTTINYKYAMNQGIPANSWEGNVGPGGAQNRQFVLTVATNLPTDYFNNVYDFGNVATETVSGGQVLTWTPGPGIRLQGTTNLLGGWTDIAGTQGQASYTNSLGGGAMYFRLKGP